MHSARLLPMLPLVGFGIAFLWLFFLQPESFEVVWKGRTFQLFFLWLVILELILGWESLQASKLGKPSSAKSVLFVLSLLLPIAFVVVFNYFGENSLVTDVLSNMESLGGGTCPSPWSTSRSRLSSPSQHFLVSELKD
jgi:hypothetical protein